MVYLIEAVDGRQRPAVIQEMIDFSWDSEQIRIAPYNGGILVDFGEPLGEALVRLVKRIGKSVGPVAREPCDTDWQVIRTYSSPED